MLDRISVSHPGFAVSRPDNVFHTNEAPVNSAKVKFRVRVAGNEENAAALLMILDTGNEIVQSSEHSTGDRFMEWEVTYRLVKGVYRVIGVLSEKDGTLHYYRGRVEVR
jgi:hypothetical protein